MKNFTVIYLKGVAVGRGNSIEFQAAPGKHQLTVAAASKRDAYVAAYRHFEKLGLNVTVGRRAADGRNKLGFDDDEIASLRNENVGFTTDYSSGIRIEGVIPTG